MKEAEKYHVLPIDDRVFERTERRAGRPAGPDGRAHVAHARRGHDRHDGEHLHQREEQVETITAEVEVPAGGAQRRDPRAGRALRRLVALREGRRAGLRLQLPRPAALHRSRRRSRSPPGKATIRFDFAYDGGGPGKGGKGTLFVNGEKVAEGRIEHTQPMIFSADETADVGIDLGTPVVEAIGVRGEVAVHRAHPEGDRRGARRRARRPMPPWSRGRRWRTAHGMTAHLRFGRAGPAGAWSSAAPVAPRPLSSAPAARLLPADLRARRVLLRRRLLLRPPRGSRLLRDARLLPRAERLELPRRSREVARPVGGPELLSPSRPCRWNCSSRTPTSRELPPSASMRR